MYTILIFPRPDSFSGIIYANMHLDTIPDNIKWIGYTEFSDIEDEDEGEHCLILSNKKLVFKEETFNRQCLELGFKNIKKFTVAVIDRTYDGIYGYFGRIKDKDPYEAYKKLMDLSKRIRNYETVPDCCKYCLKHIHRIDRRMSPRSL